MQISTRVRLTCKERRLVRDAMWAVPSSWLEACVRWILEESRGTDMPQSQVNQQALEQWLLTDLRDLSHPVLPAGISEALKTEVSGFYCLQMDSLLDISQPAYAQLQQWTGKDCSNDGVSAVTQATQRPWEAKPTRMLLLQLTDGVQNLEGMEYEPISSLNTSLRPGTKILLQGSVQCRLGVLLLKPENVKVIGGEVEDLLEQNSQSRVLCRKLGLPEETPQESGAQPDEPHRDDDGLTDEELLASLEADDQLMIMSVEASADSGYASRREPHSSSSQDPSIRNSGLHLGTSTPDNAAAAPYLVSDSPEVVHIVDEDFDDIPFEDVHNEPFVDSNFSSRAEQAFVCPGASDGTDRDKDVAENLPKTSSEGNVARLTPGSAENSRGGLHRTDISDAALLVSEEEMGHAAVAERAPSSSSPVNGSVTADTKCELLEKGSGGVMTSQCRPHGSTAAVDLDSSPFTYLSVLQTEKTSTIRVARVKAFVVTLLGSLLSNTGNWQVKVTISDGSDYLDVDLSDSVLVNLIGFSVAESKALKKDPEQRKKVVTGLQNCQRELVDMCCLMTIEYDSVNSKAVVLSVEEVSVQDCSDLEKRVQSRKRWQNSAA
ncbi:recQ-mediated genome instability protein 1 [Arapaima gigas]